MTINWRWPAITARPAACGAYGYNIVGYGNYDGGKTMAPVTPQQVSTITELKFDYDVDIQSPSENFNGLFEFFLTKSAGRLDQKQIEIGWLWHAPPKTREWAASTYQIGTFKDRWGTNWKAAASNTGVAGFYVYFIPSSGTRAKGNIDVKGALAFLNAAKLINTSWWFNGAAMGVEPLGSTGSIRIRKFAAWYR